MDALARVEPAVSASEWVEGEVVENELALSPNSASISRPRLLQRPEPAQAPDLVSLWLSRRSAHTTRAYQSDLRHFCRSFPEYDETRHDSNQVIAEFCGWPREAKVQKLEEYKTSMLAVGRAEASVNRSLSAVKSLLNLAFRLGVSDCDGRGLVDGEKVVAYRDTSGIEGKLVPKLLKMPAKLHGEGTLHALRDEVILRILGTNGVRRETLHRLNVRDFTVYNRQLALLEKGKGTQKRIVTISHPTVKAIHEYLVLNGHVSDLDGPLLRSLHRNPKFNGQRLTSHGIWRILALYGEAMELPRLTPHMLRHTVVTQLIKMGYPLTEIQKVTGHARIETLMIYADQVENKQGELTDALSDLWDEKPRKRAKK
jgi:integrase/recombinase XerC